MLADATWSKLVTFVRCGSALPNVPWQALHWSTRTARKGLWANPIHAWDATWKIHFPLYEPLCKTVTIVFFCVCVRASPWNCSKTHPAEATEQEWLKPLWFNNFTSSLWSIPVLAGSFLPLHLSLHPTILPLYFMAAAVVRQGREEIKNLCCFVVFPCGWEDVNKVLYYDLTHAHTHRHTVLKIKCVHIYTHTCYTKGYTFTQCDK